MSDTPEILPWSFWPLDSARLAELIEASNAYARCEPCDGGPGPNELYMKLALALVPHASQLLALAQRGNA